MNSNNTYVLFIICTIFGSNSDVFGQVNEIDSLLTLLPVESNDSAKAEIMAELGDIYYYENFDSSLYYYNQTIALSRQIPFFSLEYSSFRSLGYLYSHRKNDFEASLEFFDQAKKLAEVQGDSIAMAYALSDIGRIYWKQGKPFQALEHHLQVKAIGESNNHPKVKLRANLSLGILENENGNNEEAKKYYKAALELANELKKDRSKGLILNNLGKAHQDDKEYTEASNYFNQAEAIFTKLRYKLGLSLANYNKGRNFCLNGSPQEGIKYYELALSQNKDIDNLERDVMIQSALAISYKKLNLPKKAIAIAKDALAKLKDLETDLYYHELYQNLAESYEKAGDHLNSSKYFKKYIEFTEEKNEIEETKKIAKLSYLYELEKKENKILELNATNLRKDKDLKISRASYKIMALAFFALLFFILLAIITDRFIKFKKYDNIRANLADNLHDNIGTSLNHIKLLSNQMKKEQVTHEEKDVIISKIRAISDEVLYNMHDLVWSLDKKKETVADVLERIQDHADVFLGDFQIPYKFNIDIANQNMLLQSKEKVNAYLIFKESINNIMKHTVVKKVNITVTKKNVKHFKISIASFYENKISSEKLSNHSGIKSMKKRAKAVGGKLNITDNPSNFIVDFSF